MKKKLKITLNSPVILMFVFVCLAATLLGELTGGRTTELLFMTYHSSLTNPMTYLRFFTHIFGHSGWEHFVGNTAYILLLGPMLEEKYGSRTLLEVIGLTALITGVVNYLLFWNTGLCGASGVVFALILLSSFTGFREGELPLTFLLAALIYLGQQVMNGVFTVDNVSNLSHILGGLNGAFAGYVLNRQKL
ncbi:MAG: rhomboid family intramembrane serine protease [Clostridia bacterium]|nr:rhomboid family intramembrane serine protease [Clostridia bacterium]